MTVEAEYHLSKWRGLRTKVVTEVAEFRSISEQVNPYMKTISRPHLEIIGWSDDLLHEDSTYAKAISEDQIEVYDWNPTDNEHRNRRVYTGQEINEENLRSEDGRIIYRWRETQPGDYPPLRPGQEARPIELSFNL